MTEKERRLQDRLEAAGYLVLRTGLPDFFVIKDGRIKGVEHKASGATLSKEQRLAHECLTSAGIPVLVMREEDALDRLETLTAIGSLRGEVDALIARTEALVSRKSELIKEIEGLRKTIHGLEKEKDGLLGLFSTLYERSRLEQVLFDILCAYVSVRHFTDFGVVSQDTRDRGLSDLFKRYTSELEMVLKLPRENERRSL